MYEEKWRAEEWLVVVGWTCEVRKNSEETHTAKSRVGPSPGKWANMLSMLEYWGDDQVASMRQNNLAIHGYKLHYISGCNPWGHMCPLGAGKHWKRARQERRYPREWGMGACWVTEDTGRGSKSTDDTGRGSRSAEDMRRGSRLSEGMGRRSRAAEGRGGGYRAVEGMGRISRILNWGDWKGMQVSWGYGKGIQVSWGHGKGIQVSWGHGKGIQVSWGHGKGIQANWGHE